MRLRRGPVPPDDVRRALPLADSEAVLGAAADPDGRWYVGTTSALLVPDGSAYRRIAWEVIERARWDRDHETLVIEEVAAFGQPEPRHQARLPEAGSLLRLIRERVTASVVLKRFVPVEGKRGLTVIGRRAPGSDGPVEWSFLLDPALSPDDRLVRAAADQALEEAERELG